MAAFPPPTVPELPVSQPPSEGFWHRRGKLGKAGIIGGGVLVVLTALGAVLPDPDAAGSAAVASARTDVPITTQAASTSVALAPEAPPVETVAPATSAPATATPAASPLDTTPEPEAPTVARVVDGDTVDMSDGSTVRLIGIDSPEQGECGYGEAADTLGMIVYGQTVTLTPGAQDDVDGYGRLLRYLDLGNGTDANLAMIEAGQAISRYDSRDGYGRHTREDSYVAADVGSPAFCAPVTVPPTMAPQPAVALPSPPAPVQQAPTNVSYQNCDAVRAAGAAPIYRGDPGFQQKFDRDNDGVGCE